MQPLCMQKVVALMSESRIRKERQMEKYSTCHIETDGFEKVLAGMLHMIQTVPLGIKCRIILD